MFKRVLAAFMLIFLTGLTLGCTEGDGQLKGSLAADFTLQDLNGKNVTLSDFRGKAVLIDFWATWCPPCRASVPGVEKIYERYKDKGLVVLSVSLDDGAWDSVKSFISEYGITYTVLKASDDVIRAYRVRTIPLLLVLDKEGRIEKRYLGFGSEEDLEKDIKAVL